jgi:HSP20 family protein
MPNKGVQNMLPVRRVSFASSPVAAFPFSRFDSLFDQLFGNDGEELRATWGSGSLPLSIWQDENHVYVEAELPGVSDKDLDLTVHNGVLKIKADRNDEEGRAYLYNGRRFGRIERAVTLPETVDSAQVEATLTNGVLRVVLAKHAESRPKKITLKGS